MTEAEPIRCARCGENNPAAQEVPWGGELGNLIRAKSCESCWQEWLNQEVMVINELRLDFMKPESQEILVTNMRDFLALDS